MGMQFKTGEFAKGLALPVCPAGPPAYLPEPYGDLCIQFWHGASGKRYVHTVFDLLACPRLPACTYVLVRRDALGHSQALRISTVSAEAWSLNLAEIRHRAAQLGANEVHAHLIAADTASRIQVAQDLQAGQFAEFSPEPAARPERLC